MDDIGTGAAAHVRLREGTAGAHATAEATPVMARLIGGTLNEGDYLALLRGHRDLYARFETDHQRWLAGLEVEGWAYQSRRALLDADLGDTVTPPAPQHVSIEPACAWGMLYVIEGSALGGQVLLRLLRQQFPGRDHAFFSHKPQDGYSWRRFQALLDASLRNEADVERAVYGAHAMFDEFNTMLEGIHR